LVLAAQAVIKEVLQVAIHQLLLQVFLLQRLAVGVVVLTMDAIQ